MAATGKGNSAGAVVLYDFGIPKIITGRANSNISGGVFVFGSSATGIVSSGADTFVTNDLVFVIDASGSQFNGMALADTGSNGLVPVLIEGVIIAACNADVSGGMPVTCDGNNAFQVVGSGTTNSTVGPGIVHGRALTGAASGTAAYGVFYMRA